MEIELLQGSQEWLDFRRNKIGASDAAVIMGISPWKTPLQLWNEKIGFSKSEKTLGMERGLFMEEQARHTYGKIKGEIFIPRVFISDEYPWMIASMDGVNFEGNRAVEIKCPGQKDHSLAKEGRVPEHYYPQLQHQMFVLDLNEIDYFSFDAYENINLSVKRDNDYIAELIQKEKAFHDCLLEMKEPALSDRDFHRRYDPEWENTASQWLAVRDVMDNLDLQEKQLREKLISLSQGNNTQGSGIELRSYYRQGAIDYSSIPELKDIDLNSYRKKPTTITKISRRDLKDG